MKVRLGLLELLLGIFLQVLAPLCSLAAVRRGIGHSNPHAGEACDTHPTVESQRPTPARSA